MISIHNDIEYFPFVPDPLLHARKSTASVINTLFNAKFFTIYAMEAIWLSLTYFVWWLHEVDRKLFQIMIAYPGSYVTKRAWKTYENKGLLPRTGQARISKSFGDNDAVISYDSKVYCRGQWLPLKSNWLRWNLGLHFAALTGNSDFPIWIKYSSM